LQIILLLYITWIPLRVAYCLRMFANRLILLPTADPSLCEGYMLHVRAASVHSILIATASSYTIPRPSADEEEGPLLPLRTLMELSGAPSRRPNINSKIKSGSGGSTAMVLEGAGAGADEGEGEEEGDGLANIDSIRPPALPPLDQSVGAIMSLLVEDIFGAAAENKEAQGTLRSNIKETKGDKVSHFTV
jgi:hypothetical protein